MPDPTRDAVRQLENFTEGLTVNPLAPSEVRRRGDRLRRRNAVVGAVAAAAVVAVVATPIAVIAGSRDDGAPPPVTTQLPSPSPSTTGAESAWTLTIPPDFPLATGFPAEDGNSDYTFDEPSIDNQSLQAADSLSACATSPNAGDPTDRLTTWLHGPDDTLGRELQLFADDKAAAAYAASVRDVYSACPEESDGGPGTVTTTVNPVDLGDDAFVAERAFTGVGRMAVHVVRVGNAVLVNLDSDEGIDVAAMATENQKRLGRVVDAMSAFSDPNATSSPSGSSTPVSGQIPDDFPLDLDQNNTGGDGTRTGPNKLMAPVAFLEPCGHHVWPADPVDRLASVERGPEYYDGRELITLIDADAAVKFMTSARASMQACDSEKLGDGSTKTWTVHDVDLGYESLTFAATYEPLGADIYQFVRVGNSVLLTVGGGEWSAETLPVGIREQSDRTRALTPYLCLFTEAGC